MNVRYIGFALSLSGAIGTAGCGGNSAGAGPVGVQPPVSEVARPSGSEGDLLYVIHEAGKKGYGIVTMLTFPYGARVGDLTGVSEPNGICSAPHGYIWVVGFVKRRSFAYEFAHGATTPIAKIELPKKTFAGGCAVDARGDLAIQDDDSAVHGAMLVYHRHSGTPTRYRTNFEPLYSTYDGAGDLLADGIIGSTAFFVLGELPRKGRQFKDINLHTPTGFPGGMQWDGEYVALETGEGEHTKILRLESSPTGVSVIETVHLLDGFPETQIAIDDGTVAGMGGDSGWRVETWPYPAGGRPSALPGRFRNVRGLAISPGSSDATPFVP